MNPIKLFLVLSAIFRVSTLCSYCMCEKCYASDYVQDTTINQKLILWNNGKRLNINCFLQDTSDISYISPKENWDILVDSNMLAILEDVPYVMFSNVDETELLYATPYYGTCSTCYRAYYVGYMPQNGSNTTRYFKTHERNFSTENGIRLGITKDKVLQLKGESYHRYQNMITYYSISSSITDLAILEYFHLHNIGNMFTTIVFNDNDVVIGFAIGYVIL